MLKHPLKSTALVMFTMIELGLLVAMRSLDDAGRAEAFGSDDRWTVSHGSFNYLADLATRPDGTVVATGSSAVIRRDSGLWRAAELPLPEVRFKAIDYADDGSGWAVGNELIAELKDDRVVGQRDLPGMFLSDVEVLSASDGWIAGSSLEQFGTLHRLTPSGWVLHSTLKTPRSGLRGLWFRGPDEGWAVGDSGTVVRWDGMSWQTIAFSGTTFLTAVVVGPAGDLWVGGGSFHGPSGSGGHTTIFRRDNEGWVAEVSDSTAAIVDMEAAGNATYAISAGGKLYVHDAGAWSAWRARFPADVFWPITGLELSADGRTGTVVRADGAIFAVDFSEGRVNQINAMGILEGVAFTPDGRGWAVGPNQAFLIVPDGGVVVANADVGIDYALDVVSVSPQDQPRQDGVQAWMVGRAGTSSEYREGAWHKLEGLPSMDFFRVRVSPIGDVWALGAHRVASSEAWIHSVARRSRDQWELPWSTTNDTVPRIHDLALSPTGEVWLAADDGVSRIVGSRRERSALGKPTYALAVGPDGLVWAGGIGVIYRLGSGCWTPFKLSMIEKVHRIWMDTDGTGWAALSSGYLVRYDGLRWDVVRGEYDPTGSTGVPGDFHGLTISGRGQDRRVWLSGSNDSIVSAAVTVLKQAAPLTIATPIVPPTIPPFIFTPEPTPASPGICPLTSVRVFLPLLAQVWLP